MGRNVSAASGSERGSINESTDRAALATARGTDSEVSVPRAV